MEALSELPVLKRSGVLALAALVGALTCAAYLYGLYPSYFNSDAAAHQVLAEAMLREGSILPHDYQYNNQLLLWRNQLFIALALQAGATGYTAYVIGSVVTFALCFVVAQLCVDELLHDWRRSLLATWLLFLPLGRADAEYVMGQQTHVVWIVFVLLLAVHAWKAGEGSRRAIAICAAVAFAMALEAPTRAAMVLVPSAAAIWLAGRARVSLRLGAWVGLAALLGYLGSRWLQGSHSVLGVPVSPIARYSHFMERALELGRLFVDEYIGFFQFARATSQAKFLVLYGLKTIVLFAFVAIFVALAARLARRVASADRRIAHALEFIGTFAVVHFVFGFWLVCAVQYGLEVRHFLWAPVLLKLLLIVGGLDWLSRHVRPRAAQAPVAVACALLVCSSLTMMFDAAERRVMKNEARSQRALFSALGARMAELGIRNVYGTYWVVQTAEVLVPGARPAPLWTADGRAHFHSVLVPMSRRCVRGDVLYVTGGPSADEATIAQQVLSRGGRQLDALPGGQGVYVGPPVWEQDGCA